MKRRRTAPKPLRGRRWRDSHQRTVDAVLGPNVRRIRSAGNQFYNKDNWVARGFAAALVKWAGLNPAGVPTISDVRSWIYMANREIVADYEKEIVIAATPEDLPKWLAFALVGGGYHEAWHTEYSRRTPISHTETDEIYARVLALWERIPYAPEEGRRGWAGLTGPLLEWSNIVEDIRIERVGCRKYPGSPPKMEALQDLILKQELAGLITAAHRGIPINDDLGVVMGAFRDLGLGYRTPLQTTTLDSYKTRSPAGWTFVDTGPLRPFLDRSIALGPTDDMESLWLAMEIVATIAEHAKPTPPHPRPKPEDEDDDGDGPSSPSDDDDLWSVGDKAIMKHGDYRGCEVEVVKASLPDENGDQDLEYKLTDVGRVFAEAMGLDVS
jgi:hypothetical protein